MSKRKKKPVKQHEKRPLHRNRWVQFFAILVMVFAIYGNSIPNEYNIDDGYIVPLDDANPLPAEGISAIPKILASPYNDVEGLAYGYRPLGKVSMAIEYELWGNDPQKSHTVNLILYALNIFVLLLFLERIAAMTGFKNIHVLYIGVLIFLVHPIHTEVVCSIKNREEMMSYIFMLLALLIFMGFEKRKMFYQVPLFVCMLVLGVISKQTTFNVIGIMALLLLFRNLKNDESLLSFKFIKQIFSGPGVFFLGIAIVTLYLLLIELPGNVVLEDASLRIIGKESEPYLFAEGLKVIPVGLQTLWFYLKKLIIPAPLLFYYGYDMLPLIGWNSPVAIIGLIVLISMLSFVLYSLYKRKNLFLTWWILFTLVTIFPFANFGYRYVSGVVGERLAYQASFGFSIILAMAVVRLGGILSKRWTSVNIRQGHPAYWLSIIVVIPFVFLTVQRNTKWKDKLTLYKNDIVHLERSARANRMIAASYMKEVAALQSNPATTNTKKEIEHYLRGARHYMNRSVKVYPEYAQAWFDLGRIHAGYTGDIDSVIICMNRITADNEFYYIRSRELLGDLYFRTKGQPLKGFEYYKEAYLSDPSDQNMYNKAMALAFELGRASQEVVLIDSALAYKFPEAYIDRADVFWADGDSLLAVEYYESAWLTGVRPPEMMEKLEAFYLNSKRDPVWEKID